MMIPLFKVNMARNVADFVNPVLQSGYIGEGDEVVKFEKELQTEFRSITVPIAVNSCTSAIYLALLALGVGPGDEVITTPMTCVATNAPVVLLGARPVWADVDWMTGNIDPYIGHLITPRTKAIIAVDWTGRRCDYKELKKFGLPVIEDAAHGPYVDWDNCGDIICYSFGPIKHLTCGDGGAIVLTGSWNSLHEKIKLMRWYGLDRTSSKDFRCAQDIKHVGGKFHMNNINAAIGRVNLYSLKLSVESHRSNALRFSKEITQPFVSHLPFDFKSDYWIYPLRTEHRVEFEKHLNDHGIATSQVHARNDKHTGYNYPGQDLEGVSDFVERQINIPCGWWMKPSDVEYVIRVINDWRPL